MLERIVGSVGKYNQEFQDSIDTCITGYKLAIFLIHDSERRWPSKYADQRKGLRYHLIECFDKGLTNYRSILLNLVS